jgi:hypothetical protein
MRGDNTQKKAFLLSLIAGILIVINSALLGAAAKWFPGVIPTLPGSTTNDPTFLYSLTAFGLIVGILVLIGAALLRTRPNHLKAWGIMVIVFSIPSVLTGGGFIIGFILGIIGGFLTLRTPKMQEKNS